MPCDASVDNPSAAAVGPAPQVLAGRTIAVVGGGPGGVLCAAHLARLGAAVDVFESRDPEAVGQGQGKQPPAMWSIALGSCAERAIEAAGLSSDFGPQWRFEGAAMHSASGTPRFFGRWSGKDTLPQRLALSTQPGIVAHLKAECSRVYGDAVRVHYGMRAVGGDVCAGELVLQDAAGEQETRQYDVVVGADGVASAVRQLMQQQDKSLSVTIETSKVGIISTLMHPSGHPSTYSTLPTPSGAPFHAVPEDFDGALDGCAVHFFAAAPDKVKGMGRCTASVRHGGSEVVFTITGEAEWLQAPHTEEDLLAAFEVSLPNVPRAWLQRTAKAVRDRRAANELRVRCPHFVTCNKLACGRAILIGDAAHAVSPRLGMGCNSALQDSEVLSRACIAAAGDVEAAAQQYNEMRLSNVQALTHVAWRLDQVSGYQMKYHRNLSAALAGLPYYITQMANFIPPSAPVPGFLKPGFSMEKIFQEGDNWREVQSRVRGYAARLGAIFVALLAVLSALLYQAVSLVPRQAWSFPGRSG